jgi:hypothetical protein
MDTANMLELAKLYHSMGDTQKAKEIMLSTHSEISHEASRQSQTILIL